MAQQIGDLVVQVQFSGDLMDICGLMVSVYDTHIIVSAH